MIWLPYVIPVGNGKLTGQLEFVVVDGIGCLKHTKMVEHTKMVRVEYRSRLESGRIGDMIGLGLKIVMDMVGLRLK